MIALEGIRIVLERVGIAFKAIYFVPAGHLRRESVILPDIQKVETLNSWIIISLGIGGFPFQCPAGQQALTGEAPWARLSEVLRNVP